jgi:hypothetical protein
VSDYIGFNDESNLHHTSAFQNDSAFPVVRSSPIVQPEAQSEDMFAPPWNLSPQNEPAFEHGYPQYQTVPGGGFPANMHPPLTFPYPDNQYEEVIEEHGPSGLEHQGTGSGHGENGGVHYP